MSFQGNQKGFDSSLKACVVIPYPHIESNEFDSGFYILILYILFICFPFMVQLREKEELLGRELLVWEKFADTSDFKRC